MKVTTAGISDFEVKAFVTVVRAIDEMIIILETTPIPIERDCWDSLSVSVFLFKYVNPQVLIERLLPAVSTIFYEF